MLAFKILLFFAMTLPHVSALIKGPDLVKNHELWIYLLNYMGKYQQCEWCEWWGKYFRKACNQLVIDSPIPPAKGSALEGRDAMILSADGGHYKAYGPMNPEDDKGLWMCLVMPMGPCRLCVYWGKYLRSDCQEWTVDPLDAMGATIEGKDVFVAQKDYRIGVPDSTCDMLHGNISASNDICALRVLSGAWGHNGTSSGCTLDV